MDLTKILKVGDKIYSTLIGYCSVTGVDNTDPFPIKVRSINFDEFTFDKEGRYYTKLSECLLFPSKENRDWSTWKPKEECPFKPFDKVLVRDNNIDKWKCSFFSHFNIDYCASGLHWHQCIPYNKETQNLVGTNQDCPDKYRIW